MGKILCSLLASYMRSKMVFLYVLLLASAILAYPQISLENHVTNERLLFCLYPSEANNTGNLWVNYHPCIHD